MIKFSDYIVKFLANEGVKHIFLLPGGGCMHLVDSVGKSKRGKFTCMLHEQAAAIAADGYAQFTGGLGVCLVTTGPGSTNAITGVYGAWCESTPLLVISGQVKTKDIKDEPDMRMLGFQEVDIVSMVKPITKYAAAVMNPNTIRFHLEKAVHEAMSARRGPVWLNVPLDVQSAQVDPNKLKGFEVPSTPLATNHVLHAMVQKTLAMLRESKRPVILAGNGIRLGGAPALFKEVADLLPAVPILLTYKAADLLP